MQMSGTRKAVVRCTPPRPHSTTSAGTVYTVGVAATFDKAVSVMMYTTSDAEAANTAGAGTRYSISGTCVMYTDGAGATYKRLAQRLELAPRMTPPVLA